MFVDTHILRPESALPRRRFLSGKVDERSNENGWIISCGPSMRPTSGRCTLAVSSSDTIVENVETSRELGVETPEIRFRAVVRSGFVDGAEE